MDTKDQSDTDSQPTKIHIPEIVSVGDGSSDIIPGILRVVVNRSHLGIEIRLEFYLWPNWISLGSLNMNRGCMRANFPESSSPVHRIQLGLELDVRRCQVAIIGSIWIWKIIEEQIRIGLQYSIPFPTTRPAWNDAKLTSEQIHKDLDRAKYVDNVPGVSTTLSDPATRTALESILFLTGADEFLREGIAAARKLAREGDAENQKANNLLFALGAQLSGGAGVIVGLSAGIYITSDGEFGIYGTFQLDFGIVASISAKGVASIFWAGLGGTALDRFKGQTRVAGFGAGGIFAASFSFYLHRTRNGSLTLCGLSIALGPSIGLPVEFYLGNSWELLTRRLNSQSDEDRIPHYVDLLLASDQMTMIELPQATE